MKQIKPVNHNPLKYRFPVMAIVSVLHRISGVVLLFTIAFWLWLLTYLKLDGIGYQHAVIILNSFIMQLILFLSLLALAYHVLAGFRHLIMDLGFLETLRLSRVTAWSVIVLEIIVAVGLGIWIW